VTPDQNLELLVSDSDVHLRQALGEAGFTVQLNGEGALRVCPGKPECRMGLCETGKLAQHISDKFGPLAQKYSLAISGCRNSCAQPQLADFGILASRLKSAGDQPVALFDLYRRHGEGLGEKTATGLTEGELLSLLSEKLSA
jgi:sulfite reductase beta subunit-like hemoprotein